MLACDDLNRTPVIPGLAGGGNPESMPPPLGAAWIPGSPLTRRPGVTGERKTEGKDAHDDDDCNRRPPAGAVRPHLQSADNPYKIAGPRMDAGSVEHDGAGIMRIVRTNFRRKGDCPTRRADGRGGGQPWEIRRPI